MFSLKLCTELRHLGGAVSRRPFPTFECTFRVVSNGSSKTKPVVKLDEQVDRNLQDQVYKPRQHPGRIRANLVTLPETFVQALHTMCEEYSITTLMNDARSFYHHLWNRRPPIEPSELRDVKADISREIVEKAPQKEYVDEEQARQSLKDKINRKLKDTVYNWKAIDFNLYTCLLYLFARFPAEYAVLTRIFKEIAERDPQFKPRGLFDFGSGVGSVTWAANQFWKKHIFEYFNVDSSHDMNDVAELLLKGGIGMRYLKPGTYYRQFLPSTPNQYELVVSAYSLMELPSRHTRLQTILNLWNRTSQYLVIVEVGTLAGFEIVSEVRDFILQISKDGTGGHVFSPCPHDHPCPRLALCDETPCNFEVAYRSLPFRHPIRNYIERYSYVVLKKGKREDNDPQWPRIVRSPMVRSKHTICRMCTKWGKLEEMIFTASKHGKMTYQCARVSDWGDRLPIDLEKRREAETCQEIDVETMSEDDKK